MHGFKYQCQVISFLAFFTIGTTPLTVRALYLLISAPLELYLGLNQLIPSERRLAVVIEIIAQGAVMQSAPYFKHFELRKQMGAKWHRSGLGQVTCWRFGQFSFSGDSHGQSQYRPSIVRRAKVLPQRDEL